jgi:aspartate/methionine/tyrosine aminotransferase
MQAIINPGDGIVIFEPFFDFYIPPAKLAGAQIEYVALTPNQNTQEWEFDINDLQTAIQKLQNPRMILLNTPHNPTGKVFSQVELEAIAKLVLEHPNLLVVSDEVYEHLTFSGHKHIRIASLPGMFDRTITISSAGKTFAVTGWKVGWAIGPAEIISAMYSLHQFIVFSVCTPVQHAVALALEEANKPYKHCSSYYEYFREDYAKKRDLLVDGLVRAGLKPYVPAGTFFVVADCSSIRLPAQYAMMGVPRDWALARYLTCEVGVCGIPLSPFMSVAGGAGVFIRFAFCKSSEILERGLSRLIKLR